MAAITATPERIDAFPYPAQLYTWTPVAGSDTCVAVKCPQLRDKSIQVAGTFDSASIALHGSNDGTNYAALSDPAGTTIAITAAGIVQVGQITQYIKPVTSGGGGSSSVSIMVLGAAGKV